jgi:hypothetical protein
MKIPKYEDFKLEEDFENPFDNNDKIKKSKHISDSGGVFLKKATTFNASRLEVTKKGKSYVISARTQFARGEIVEVCPVIQLGSESTAIDTLRDIVFELDKNNDQWALVLGYGSLYGHSDKPNLDYAYNKKNRQMVFIAKNSIQMGEEFTINYGNDFWMQRRDFGTVAERPNEPDATITKLMPKEIVDESSVQPDQADVHRGDTFSSPKGVGNPAVTGKALMGTGQS